jgi:hypothetical protein
MWVGRDDPIGRELGELEPKWYENDDCARTAEAIETRLGHAVFLRTTNECTKFGSDQSQSE